MTEEQKKALSNLRKTLVACNRLNYCESAIAELEAALTQPARPALKLPETISVRTAIAALDNASSVTTIAQSYKMAWNSCIAETKRLNAPHTTPIEPPGGAEWVKVSERMPHSDDLRCLVFCQDRIIRTGFTSYGDWALNGKYYAPDYVSHWLPLPAEPEEK